MPLELLAGAAVGAAVASESGRKVIRQGLLYGVAGALIVYDQAAALACGVSKGMSDGISSAFRQHEAPATSSAADSPAASHQPRPTNV